MAILSVTYLGGLTAGLLNDRQLFNGLFSRTTW